MIVRCTDPRCHGCCTVMEVVGGYLVVRSRHHGELHTSRVPLDALTREAAQVH